jgi:hypothetical protein
LVLDLVVLAAEPVEALHPERVVLGMDDAERSRHAVIIYDVAFALGRECCDNVVAQLLVLHAFLLASDLTTVGQRATCIARVHSDHDGIEKLSISTT